MPEVFYTIQLPDGSSHECYSPSSVIRSYFRPEETLDLNEFISRSRVALNAASERVRAKYGYACTSAMSQLADIERLATRYPAEGTIRILKI